MSPSPQRPAADGRFDRRREDIVAAAIALLNERGVKGMTMPDVAARVGMSATGLTYYFKRKEALAVACIECGVEDMAALVRTAAAAPDPVSRVRALVGGYLDAQAAASRGNRRPIAVLSDARALSEPAGRRLSDAYRDTVLTAASDLFDGLSLTQEARAARAHMLLEQLYWSVAWLGRYDWDELPRVRERYLEVLVQGLAGPDTRWHPGDVPMAVLLDQDPRDQGRAEFFQAAIQLINERGYRGASVERISAERGLTKGAFYHHIDAKDDLVVACFKHSFAVMRRAHRAASTQPGDAWLRLATVVSALVRYQLSAHGPLLRTLALSGLPPRHQYGMVMRSNRVSYRFAGLISDGWADGSVTAVDPFIASQLIMAAINGAADLPRWLPDLDRGQIDELYTRPLLTGLLRP